MYKLFVFVFRTVSVDSGRCGPVAAGQAGPFDREEPLTGKNNISFDREERYYVVGISSRITSALWAFVLCEKNGIVPVVHLAVATSTSNGRIP
jgi:hypothetical protein